MAALVLGEHASLNPGSFEEFLAAQPDLSPKGWPTYVRIVTQLPTTATHKVLKRELAAQDPSAGNAVLRRRDARDTRYEATPSWRRHAPAGIGAMRSRRGSRTPPPWVARIAIRQGRPRRCS